MNPQHSIKTNKNLHSVIENYFIRPLKQKVENKCKANKLLSTVCKLEVLISRIYFVRITNERIE